MSATVTGSSTVYAIVQLRIHDEARLERYAAGFMPVLHQYGGRLIVADGSPEVAEGEWTGDRVVVLAFDDRDAYHTWANSPEYQAIVKDRWAAAETTILLVRGVD